MGIAKNQMLTMQYIYSSTSVTSTIQQCRTHILASNTTTMLAALSEACAATPE
jgi:hypothetical protein